MRGIGLGLFRQIRIAGDEESTEGIRVAMGRARGELRKASIRTAGATPGVYAVELVDVHDNVLTLDLEVTVEGDDDVASDKGRTNGDEPEPLGRAIIEFPGLMDGPARGVVHVDLGGVEIDLHDVTTGDQTEFREFTYGDVTHLPIAIGFRSGPSAQPLLDWHERSQEPIDVLLTFGDRDGQPGVQLRALECVPVNLETDDKAHILTLQPQRLVPVMSGFIGRSAFTLEGPLAGEPPARSYQVEVDIDGTSYRLGGDGSNHGPVVAAGGAPETEEISSTTGSGGGGETTAGHALVNDLLVEVPWGLDHGALPALANDVVNSGNSPLVTVRVVILARDGSPVRTYTYENCLLRALNLGGFRAEPWTPPMLRAVFAPSRLSVN